MSMSQSLTVLILDKDTKSLDRLGALLAAEAYQPIRMSSADALMRSTTRYDIACLDSRLGADVVRRAAAHVHAQSPHAPIILLTEGAKDKVAPALADLKLFDEVSHSGDNRKLLLSLRNASYQHMMSQRIAHLEREINGRTLSGLVGQSATMRRLYNEIERVSQNDLAVLLIGENGTGKEAIARTIHGLSTRAQGPFVVLDCAAWPVNVQDAELFGVEIEGQLTRLGKLEQASGGTLLLKGLPSLSLLVQARLFQAIERRRFYRVNSSTEVALNVRIITTLPKRLTDEIRQGLVREDLYFSLAVFEMSVPALRERLGDTPVLARHFTQTICAQNRPNQPCTLSDESLALLEAYDWPGNIRELRNAIERALVVCKGSVITPDDLPPQLRTPHAVDASPPTRGRRARGPRLSYSASDVDASLISSLADVERGAIENMMRKVNGNISLAARQLGIGRSTLYRKLKSYGHKVN